MNRWTSPPKARSLPAAVAAAMLAALSLTSAAAGPAESWDKYRILTERNIFVRNRRPWRPRVAPSTRPRIIRTRDTDRDIILTGIARRGDEFVAFFEDTRFSTTKQFRAGEAIGKGKVAAITLDGVAYERGESVKRIEIGRSLTGSVELRLLAPSSLLGPVLSSPSLRSTPGRSAAPGPSAARAAPGPSAARAAPGPSAARAAPGPSATPRAGPPTRPARPTTKPSTAPRRAPSGTTSGGSKDSDIEDILERMRRRREQELRK